jgi:hypothetical protein
MACEALLENPGRSGTAVSNRASVRSKVYEPALDELFAEPIVRQLMCSDGVDEEAVRRLLQRAAALS